jgi:hypothetical protein
LTATDAGEQVTVVAVVRFVTVTSNVSELEECTVLPPYEPVIVCVPVLADGMYVTEQDDVVVAPTCASVHDVPGLENVPDAAGEALKLTLPVGKDFVPTSLSATVAVHVVPWPKATLAGVQVTVVAVARSVAVTANPSGSLLAACGLAPP